MLRNQNVLQFLHQIESVFKWLLLPSIRIESNSVVFRKKTDGCGCIRKFVGLWHFCILIAAFCIGYGEYVKNQTLINLFAMYIHFMDTILLTLILFTFPQNEKQLISIYSGLYSIEQELKKKNRTFLINYKTILFHILPVYFHAGFILLWLLYQVVKLLDSEWFFLGFLVNMSYLYAEWIQMTITIRFCVIICTCGQLFGEIDSGVTNAMAGQHSRDQYRTIRFYGVVHEKLSKLINLNNFNNFFPTTVYIYYNQSMTVYRLYCFYKYSEVLYHQVALGWVLSCISVMTAVIYVVEKCKKQVRV
jgi:hypothetical protein